ncbi:restriction endonuclease subunit S [Janthinobacterium sp. PC23-8]|uniref:restriction endonuclease subunit S n=1 Tax=Janthinobacterium sp. PC23-8 TaxID=2012679 RepID=UPI000B962BDA|nr:restriction endonuclease subunit S [Janthinobacterium sp. PC23-8]OYO31690.1 hypothetical protein CD932_11580 [Janthinobacterium sp. PC23-8]
MSSEWRATTLGEVCKAQGGAIQTGPFGSQLHTSDYQQSGAPVVMPTNIGDGGIITNGIARVGESDVARLAQHKLQLGDVVFSRRGDVTKNALVRSREVGWLCGTGCLKVRLGDESVATAKFISHCLRAPDTKDWLIRHAVGATMPNLNTGILSAVPISLPPMGIQLAIVDMLDALDDRISLLRETNATLEAIAQALFKSWFVDFDPVRAKLDGRVPEGMDEATAALFPATFDESEIGMVPKGWRVTTLGSICKDSGGAIQTGPFGSQLHASDYLDIGVPVVMPQDLAGRRVQVEKIARVGDDDVRRLSRHWLRTGDIVFSRRGDVGRHALVGVRESGWLCGTGCLLVRPGQSWPSATYLSLALDRADAKEWLLRHAVGATMPNLNTGILSAVPIMRADDLILQAFDEIVCRLDDRISHGHANIRALVELRDTLLPRLISGQLRLPEAETVFEKAAA